MVVVIIDRIIFMIGSWMNNKRAVMMIIIVSNIHKVLCSYSSIIMIIEY